MEGRGQELGLKVYSSEGVPLQPCSSESKVCRFADDTKVCSRVDIYVGVYDIKHDMTLLED